MTDEIDLAAALIVDLSRLIHHIGNLQGDNWKRLRIAISPEEDLALNKYFKTTQYGNYVRRLRGIVLQVELQPKNIDNIVFY